MSVVYCHDCDKYIDTDFNAEHFEEHTKNEWTLKDFESTPGVYLDGDGFVISKEEALEEVAFKNRRYNNG